jgi:hypothetical protein
MKRLCNKEELYFIHCILIPVFFIVHNYFFFYGLVDFSALLSSLISWLALPFLVYGLILYLLKNKSGAALYTSVLLLLFFFGSSLLNFLKTVPYIEYAVKYSITIPLLVVLFIIFFIYLRKSQKNYRQAHLYLTITFLLLILVDLVIYLPKSSTQLKAVNTFKTINRPALNNQTPDTSRPDIFFFIFDEHPSTSSVKLLTGYNNISLDTQLQNLGFRVSSNATSGFSSTTLALTSLFDMGEYPYKDGSAITFKEIFGGSQLLTESLLFPFLQQQHYNVINASVFNFKSFPAVQTPKEWWGKPGEMITNQTFFNRINQDIGWLKPLYFPGLFKNSIQESIHADDSIATMVTKMVDSSTKVNNTKPKFVFAHYFLPHDPFKYDSTGHIRKLSYKQHIQSLKTSDPFIEQLVYTRKLIVNLASSILKNNKRPAVIIIQGDHGLRNYNHTKYGKDELFKIFSAVYFPDRDYSKIHDDFFSPNTFRVVLNKYFNQNLSLQQPWHLDLTLSARVMQ